MPTPATGTQPDTLTVSDEYLALLEAQYGATTDAWWAEAEAVARSLLSQQQPATICKLPPWGAIATFMAFNGVDEGLLKFWDRDWQPPALQDALAAALSVALQKAERVGNATAATTSGKARITSQDYLDALSDLGYSFRMNMLDDSIEVNNVRITDTVAAEIRTRMRDRGFREMQTLEDAYTAHAYQNRYHPVQAYLEGLSYDGGQHIAALASHFTDKYNQFGTWLQRWLVGAVARAYSSMRAGVQNRMLIIDGPQDVGKSFFTRWLCRDLPDLFVESAVDPDNKDHYIRLMRTWVWEVAELGSSMRRADREALKAFLSTERVTVRMPYGHHDLHKPALSSFIGTVNNESGILNDPTGSRRFFISHVTAIDWNYATTINPASVWAEARALFLAGEPWKLTPAEYDEANRINEEYEVQDPLDDLLQKNYEITGNSVDFVSTIDILDRLHLAGWKLGIPKAEAMALASVMRKCGLESKQMLIQGIRMRGYVGLRDRLIP